MDLKQIQELIRFVAKSGVSEVQLEVEDFKIIIKTEHGKEHAVQTVYAPQPVMQQQPIPIIAPPPQTEEKTAEKAAESKLITIKSPMIGTFYRKPGPDKEPFVKVGDSITTGQIICVIEAMKLFNEIESDINGTIVKILVDDMTPVEYDQPLFLVEP